MRTESTTLIVEDDPATRRALSEGLTSSGYAAVVVATAEEALSALEVVSADLALVDFRLPGMNGVDLLHNVRQHSPATVLVIIAGFPSVESAVELFCRADTSRLEASPSPTASSRWRLRP